jgi:N-acetylmuramoyl-L-alanine amidase CwlA
MAATMKEWNLTHAPRSMFLPDFVNVQTKIVTHDRTTSGRVAKPKTSNTFHDTANPRTTAAGEWSWLAGGRQGGSLGGYTAIGDDKGIIYCGYFDWETWHAGVQAGNLYSWGTEFAFGGGVVWTTALENICAWHGGLMEMGGLDVESAFRWHKYWTGKYCPGQIFNRGL